jgi:hypothetical protein
MLAADEATAKSHAQGFGLAPKLTVTFGPKNISSSLSLYLL